ncbi:TolC family protein [Duganella sp. BJB488]|nr:TolC family protein [Duganella sp. BJB489]RFP27036.1 TolC family protein [Duganella sp. BJB488]RFP34879.1 TolC family protein [Duganella sp. BJB480]
MREARMRLRLVKLAFALAALGNANAWAGGTALPLAGDMLFGLPREQTVRQLLSQLPQLRIGAINNQLAGAEQAKLAAGPGEWVVRGGVSRRSVLDGDRYREQELAVERSVRWFGKAEQDRAVGEKGMALAQAQRADAWHEAGRALMQDWYEALKAQATLERLREQHALIKQLRSIAEVRVKAGDGARLELMQADTELRRADALIEQADQQVQHALTLLATNYPGLPAPQLAQVPDPQPMPLQRPEQLARILDDNHELELAQVEAQWYGLKAKRAASERMPDPTIAIRAGRERAGQERTIGLTLSMALPGGARDAESSAAYIRSQMADERVAQVRTKVALAAQRAVTEQEYSYQVWTSLRAVEQQSDRQARLMELGYKAGEYTLAEALLGRRLAMEAALASQIARIAAVAASARVQLDAHALWAID